MFYLVWRVANNWKGLLFWIIAALSFCGPQKWLLIAHTLPSSLQNGKSLLNSKKIIFFFVRKTWNFTQRVLRQRLVICYETAYWSKIAHKFKMAAIIDQNRVKKNITHGHWAVRVLKRATPTVTRDIRF